MTEPLNRGSVFYAQKGGEEHRNYHHHPYCSEETD